MFAIICRETYCAAMEQGLPPQKGLFFVYDLFITCRGAFCNQLPSTHVEVIPWQGRTLRSVLFRDFLSNAFHGRD